MLHEIAYRDLGKLHAPLTVSVKRKKRPRAANRRGRLKSTDLFSRLGMCQYSVSDSSRISIAESSSPVVIQSG